MIYFNSDYLEGAHPALMAKLNETNMVQTIGYGEDEYCAAARVKIQNACQAPEADVHFLVGGTQTNTTVIAAVLRPWQGVLCAVSGHINCHEAGAIESTGHKVITLPTTNGKITAQQVQEYVEWHRNDESTEHIVQPGMVYISYPTEGGTLYSKADQETEAASMSAMVVFPLYYLALVLTMTAATILTVQQLSETDRYRGQLALLRKLGMDRREMRRALGCQFAIYYAMPALPPALIAVPFLLNLGGAVEPGTMTGIYHPAAITALALGLFCLIYLFYILMAYTSLKRNVLPQE